MQVKPEFPSLREYPECYIAHLDILGFKEYVKGTAHDPEIMVRTFNTLLNCIHGQLATTLELQETGEFIKVISKMQSFNYLVISDSIILWTDTASAQSFINLVTAVKNILHYSMMFETPIRGAIVCNKVFMFESKQDTEQKNMEASIIGPGIIEAYEMAEAQDWAGCAISEQAMEVYRAHFKDEILTKVSDKNPSKDLLNKANDATRAVYAALLDLLIARYDVPFKDGTKDLITVDWTTQYHYKEKASTSTIMKIMVESAFTNYRNYHGQSAVKIKLINTLEYLEAMEKELERIREEKRSAKSQLPS